MVSGIKPVSQPYITAPVIAFGAQTVLHTPDRITFSGQKDVQETPKPGHVRIGGIPFLGFLRLLKTMPSVLLNIGGHSLDKQRMKEGKAHWKAEVKRQLEELATAPDYGKTLPRVASTMTGFDIEHWQGLPPSVKWVDDEKKPANCNGAIAEMVLYLLDQLPPANDMEEAVCQLTQLLDQVPEEMLANGKKLTGVETKKEPAGPTPEDIRSDLKPGSMINQGGYSIAAVRGQNWSMIQTRHLVRVAANGAVQVLLIPSAKELADIIRHDDTARASLDAQPVLSNKHWGFYPYKGTLNAEQTIALLEDDTLSAAHMDERSQWSDTHTLMRDMPFDLEKQIAEGRVKVIFDKPGADGQRVQEAQ